MEHIILHAGQDRVKRTDEWMAVIGIGSPILCWIITGIAGGDMTDTISASLILAIFLNFPAAGSAILTYLAIRLRSKRVEGFDFLRSWGHSFVFGTVAIIAVIAFAWSMDEIFGWHHPSDLVWGILLGGICGSFLLGAWNAAFPLIKIHSKEWF